MKDPALPANLRERTAHSRAKWLRAYELQLKGDLAGAIEGYHRSLAIHPTAEAHTFLGWAYSFQGDLDAAIHQCERAIEVDPTFGNPYNDIGAYLIQLGRYAEALPWLKRALKARRYEPRHYPHYNLGFALLNLGRTDEALLEFKRALRRCPDYQPAARMVDYLKDQAS
jgi:Tfp pilus assembly protein PilF